VLRSVLTWLTTSSEQSRNLTVGELNQKLRENAFRRFALFRQGSQLFPLRGSHAACSPPLVQERAGVLDTYFDDITVERVKAGEGWKQIQGLPKLNTQS
jgi:hypothetical protein